MADDPGKMHFRRMDAGTDADFAVLAKVHEENIRKQPGQARSADRADGGVLRSLR